MAAGDSGGSGGGGGGGGGDSGGGVLEFFSAVQGMTAASWISDKTQGRC